VQPRLDEAMGRRIGGSPKAQARFLDRIEAVRSPAVIEVTASPGKPAAVALQPKFYDAESAFLSGCAARVASARGVDILEFPEELGWLSRPAEPRALLLWVPAPLDD
jgi:hypothetical protein